jgi:radical SAM PhpK family P-methyltransferase
MMRVRRRADRHPPPRALTRWAIAVQDQRVFMKLPLVAAPPPPSAREALPPARGLDCVVVGPHELDFHTVVTRARSTQGVSGYYDDVKLNSVLIDGRRLQYTELFNRVLADATGREHALNPFRQPSAAVCYLTSFLRRRGLAVELVNFFSYERDRLRALLAEKPRAVVLTTTFYIDPDPINEVVRFIREHAPETQIVLGGPYIYRICSNFDAPTQEYLFQGVGADIYIFDSQGESTLASLLAALRLGATDAQLASVPNLIWTHDNQVFRRSDRLVENNDMDENAVDWTLFDKDYITPTVYMRTARSCPFACSFCCYPIAAGDHVLNEVETIITQLRAVRELGVENVVFVDDTFNVPLPRFKQLLRRMIEEKLDLRWMSFLRCSNSDPEMFELMARSGCALSFLGIESGDTQILTNMDKFAKVDRYRDGIRRLKENGIYCHASLIVGFPGETQKTVDTTIEFIETTQPTSYAAQLFYHDPRAPLQKRAEEFGLQGTGFAWQHATAHWSDAVAWTRQMLERIEHSACVGGYSLGCWGMFYLQTLGYSLDQLKSFLNQTRDMVVEGLDEREATGYDRLVSLFRSDAAAVARAVT